MNNEMAWLAGFLEGEGSFCSFNVGPKKTSTTVQVSFHSTDEDVAKRAAMLMGVDASGPHNPSGASLGKKPYWQVRLTGDRSVALMIELLPLMGKRRSEQIREAIQKWESRPRRIRDRGAPLTCGHERDHYALGLCKCCYEQSRHLARKSQVTLKEPAVA